MSETRTEIIEVGESHPDERLDAFLAGIYQAVSRGTIQRLIKEGEIRVNEERVKPNHRPRVGERIQVHFPEPRAPRVEAVEMPLEVLYEDADLIVLDKQAGLLTHMASGEEEHTLVNALLHHCRGGLSGVGGEARPGIVHRLDKDTSGCIVAAKNDAAHNGLAKQFAERGVGKVYQALVCGEVAEVKGEIQAPIVRHPNHRTWVVGAGGRQAHTSFEIIERLRSATLMRVFLHTGRTHQIRVHFKHLGHPLVGDDLYGKRQNIRLAEETGCRAPRQMLHSGVLAFDHPVSGKRLKFTAPLPEDFLNTLKQLRYSE